LGQVVAAANLTIEGDARSVTTDTRGHFVLDRLAEGSFVIRAEHPAAGVVSQLIRVRRGRDPASVVLRLPQRYDTEREISTRALRHGVAAEVADVEDAVHIVMVAPGARATSTGLREGDVLHAVDGVPVEDAEHAVRLLRGADGISAILDLERDGELFRLRIPRETW
jgi:S1-C subfamily serine protease